MVPGFDVPGGVLNIIQTIDVILRYVKGYRGFEKILKSSAAEVKTIESNVRTLQKLQTLDGPQSNFFAEAVQGFEDIRDELMSIRDKVANRHKARTFLSSTGLIEKLTCIDKKLDKKDDALRTLGMVGLLNVEHRYNSADTASLLDKVKSVSSDVFAMKSLLAKIYQTKMFEENATGQGSSSIVRKQKDGFMDLATGVCLYEGHLGTTNFQEAAQYFNVASKAGVKESYYYLGIQHLLGKGVEVCNVRARNFFELGSKAGDVKAFSRLGQCYHFGIGVEQDPEEGMKYIKQGAEAEDPIGMGLYTYMKLHGIHTSVNLPLVFRIAFNASKKGRAKYELALCYEQGIEVERNPQEAVRLYTEAVEDNTSFTANIRLAQCYEEGTGVQVNLERAAQLYKQGTSFEAWKRPYFQAYYGLCLIRGRGVCKDSTKGWDEIRKSIKGKNANGWYAKGECYRFGYGIESDLKKALACNQRAKEQEDGMDGKIRASYILGCMYEGGEGGLQVDFAEAFEHFNFAANRMHQKAQWKVAVSCESGIGVGINEDRAVHYFKLAANSGHRESQLRACKYYIQGKGVSRDLHKSIQILKPAADAGDIRAKILLRRSQVEILIQRICSFKSSSVP